MTCSSYTLRLWVKADVVKIYCDSSRGSSENWVHLFLKHNFEMPVQVRVRKQVHMTLSFYDNLAKANSRPWNTDSDMELITDTSTNTNISWRLFKNSLEAFLLSIFNYFCTFLLTKTELSGTLCAVSLWFRNL